MTDKIRFGTDGWRAVIADTYTFENVHRVTSAVSSWLRAKSASESARVVLGYDCRFSARLFAREVAKHLAHSGHEVLLSPDFVSTPAVSLAVVEEQADLGIVLTASHNPPEYGGYKLKGNFGGPLPEPDVKAIEALIPPSVDFDWRTLDFDPFLEAGQIREVDLEKAYLSRVKEHFDLGAIARSPFKFGFDAMYGAGQRIVSRILPDVATLHCTYNPSFGGTPPEPIARNLLEFQSFVPQQQIDCGLVTDGDADRIALVDADGSFIDAHHIILILIHYLHHYKKMTGDVVTAVSSTNKIAALCERYGLGLDIVKIGFKHTSEIMREKDILVGGEESGGIAVKGHIPERDGIWMGLIIWEFMAKTGKSLRAIIDEVYALVGSFAFVRNDLRLAPDEKERVVAACERDAYMRFGSHTVQSIDKTDGFKFILDPQTWVMIRPSGTEPVLRIYAEAPSQAAAEALVRDARATIKA